MFRMFISVSRENQRSSVSHIVDVFGKVSKFSKAGRDISQSKGAHLSRLSSSFEILALFVNARTKAGMT